MMDLVVKKDGKYSRIIMKGKFVIEEVSKFENECQKLQSSDTKVTGIDFSSVDYLDSSAIGALVKLMNTSKNSGIEIYLYNMDSNIQHIFKLAFLDRFFTITDRKYLETVFPDFVW